MNLEERIESAWKEHWNSSGLHAGESFTDFPVRLSYGDAVAVYGGEDELWFVVCPTCGCKFQIEEESEDADE